MGLTITVATDGGADGYSTIQYKGITYAAGSSFEVEYGDKVQITLSWRGTDESLAHRTVTLNGYKTNSGVYGWSIGASSYEYIPNNDATITKMYSYSEYANDEERYAYYGMARICESDTWGEPPSAGESAQTVLLDGTLYHIKGGKTLIEGTAYAIKQGKTLINGTVYALNFGGSGGYRLTLTACNSSTGMLHITVTDKDGNKKHEYGRGTTGKSYAAFTVWADLLATDSVTVKIDGSSSGEYVWLNGSQVASASNKGSAAGAEYTITSITGDIQIAQEDSNDYYYAKITMPA